MAMQPLKDNVAIAIDGGGIKGLIVSKGLARLEHELGDTPLIHNPKIKVLAGTSTGSLINMGLSIGMTADQISEIYVQFGQDVFPPLTPVWMPDFIRKGYEMFLMVTRHSLYKSDKLKEFLRNVIGHYAKNPDITLGELKTTLLRNDQAVIFTTVNITQRRTRFIKTYQDKWADWMLWEAALVSAVAPVALPVYARMEGGKLAYYTDGGVGSYGNPAYIAAEEAITFQYHSPDTVTVLSFGTGWVEEDNYVKEVGDPTKWAGLDWALNAPLIVTADATRTQSIDILDEYGRTFDLRRFQFSLEKDITSDAYASKETYNQMVQLGEALGDDIINNNYAPKEPTHDPEGIREALDSYYRAQREKE